MTAIFVCAERNSPETELLAFRPNWAFFFLSLFLFFCFVMPILLPSRNTKKTMQFKRPELPACHLAVTLNCLCSAWAVFFHIHTHATQHTRTHIQKGLLQHPKNSFTRGEERQNFQNITLIKYSCSSGILLCSFSIRKVKWKRPVIGLHPKKRKREERERERDLFPLGKDRK